MHWDSLTLHVLLFQEGVMLKSYQALLLLSLAAVLGGMLLAQPFQVWINATLLCLSCIGIG